MRPHWIQDWCPYEKSMCRDVEGRSQGMLRIDSNHRKLKENRATDSASEFSEGINSADTLISDF